LNDLGETARTARKIGANAIRGTAATVHGRIIQMDCSKITGLNFQVEEGLELSGATDSLKAKDVY
jgi:hypothetical protein